MNRITFDEPKFLPGIVAGKNWMITEHHWIDGWNHTDIRLWFGNHPIEAFSTSLDSNRYWQHIRRPS